MWLTRAGDEAIKTDGRRRRTAAMTESSERNRKEREGGVLAVEMGCPAILRET